MLDHYSRNVGENFDTILDHDLLRSSKISKMFWKECIIQKRNARSLE